MQSEKPIVLNRDCEAVMIPSGEKITLARGSTVWRTQSLGGSYTVMTDRGYMARIEGRDADVGGRLPDRDRESGLSNALQDRATGRIDDRPRVDPRGVSLAFGVGEARGDEIVQAGDHVLDLGLSTDRQRYRSIVLIRGRDDPDFSERDRAILELLRPHLRAREARAELERRRSAFSLSQLVRREARPRRIPLTELQARLAPTLRKKAHNYLERGLDPGELDLLAYVNLKRAVPDFNVFYRYYATYPYYSDAVWYLTQMRRWGQIGEHKADEWYFDVARQVYRPDIYLEAARLVVEDGHADEADFPWDSDGFRAPQSEFIDGITFDGRMPNAYLEQFPIGLKGTQKVAQNAVVGG